MIRHPSPIATLMPVPLLLALLGAAFCAWSASGNALNLCFTAGCSLYQDVTIAGISLWWVGVAAFCFLGFLAIIGRPWLGIIVSGLFLFIDVLLLLLMMLTAPCVGCLGAALLFALCYMAFRQTALRRDVRMGRSWLAYAWVILFIVNVGAVVRAETGTWSILGPHDATVRVYFSPSCKACRETVHALSGRVHVAFYPVAENEADVLTIHAMKLAIDKGASIYDALSVKSTSLQGIMAHCAPDVLILRLRLLYNKAHVLSAGSQRLPFVEYQGMPSGLAPKPAARTNPSAPAQDAALPVDGNIAGSCGGVTPCP